MGGSDSGYEFEEEEPDDVLELGAQFVVMELYTSSFPASSIALTVNVYLVKGDKLEAV